MRLTITVKGGYEQVLDKILEHRPHLKTRTGAVERAMDYYLDSIIRLDLEKNRQIKEKGDVDERRKL